MTTRTRFAPSPTGYMHIGNLRTALYEYLIARSLGGKFILRLEDTDRDRLVEGAEQVIYQTLAKVGLRLVNLGCSSQLQRFFGIKQSLLIAIVLVNHQ